MRITLELEKKDIEFLCTSLQRNFSKEQPGRFITLKGRLFSTGEMYFFVTYLDALVAYTYFKKSGKKASILSDEWAGNESAYIVIVSKK